MNVNSSLIAKLQKNMIWRILYSCFSWLYDWWKSKKTYIRVVALHVSLVLRRIEETRTPDPHVPNVVRYQLRYYPNTLLKISCLCLFAPFELLLFGVILV